MFSRPVVGFVALITLTAALGFQSPPAHADPPLKVTLNWTTLGNLTVRFYGRVENYDDLSAVTLTLDGIIQTTVPLMPDGSFEHDHQFPPFSSGNLTAWAVEGSEKARDFTQVFVY